MDVRSLGRRCPVSAVVCVPSPGGCGRCVVSAAGDAVAALLVDGGAAAARAEASALPGGLRVSSLSHCETADGVAVCAGGGCRLSLLLLRADGGGLSLARQWVVRLSSPVVASAVSAGGTATALTAQGAIVTAARGEAALCARVPRSVGLVTAAAFATVADSPLVLVGTMAGRVVAARIQDGEVRTEAVGTHAATAHVRCCAVAASGGGAVAVTGGDDRVVRMWRLAGGWSEVGRWEGHSTRVLSVAVVSDAVAVSSSDNGAVLAWAVGSDRPLRQLRGPGAAVTQCLGAAPLGSGLAAVCAGSASGMLAECALPLQPPPPPPPPPPPARERQQLRLVCAGAAASELVVWAAAADGGLLSGPVPGDGLDAGAPVQLRRVEGVRTGRATAMAAGGGGVIIGDDAGNVGVAAAGSFRSAEAGLLAKVVAVACEGPVAAAGSATGEVAVYRIGAGAVAAEGRWSLDRCPVTALAVSCGGSEPRVVCGQRSGAVHLLTSGVVSAAQGAKHDARITAAAAAAWGAATADASGAVLVWVGGGELVAARQLRTPSITSDVLHLSLHAREVGVSAVVGCRGSSTVCFSPDQGEEVWAAPTARASRRSLTAAAAASGRIAVCYVASGSECHVVSPRPLWACLERGPLLRGDVHCAADCGGVTCCGGDQDNAAVLLSGTTRFAELRGAHDSGITAVAAGPGGVATAGGGDAVALWTVRADGVALLRRLLQVPAAPEPADKRPRVEGAALRSWQKEQLMVRARAGAQHRVVSMCWCGGSLVVGRDTGELCVFEKAGARLLAPPEHFGATLCLASDGAVVVAGGSGGAVWVREADGGGASFTPLHDGGVNCAALHRAADGSVLLAAGGDDQSVAVAALSGAKVLAAARVTAWASAALRGVQFVRRPGPPTVVMVAEDQRVTVATITAPRSPAPAAEKLGAPGSQRWRLPESHPCGHPEACARVVASVLCGVLRPRCLAVRLDDGVNVAVVAGQGLELLELREAGGS